MAESIETKKRPALSGWPMIFGWLAMMIFALHSSTHMVGAGDTWVAMACGRHFLNHGVDTIEPFSANSHKAGPNEETMSAYAKQLYNSVKNKPGIKASMARWWAGKAVNFGQWPEWQKSFAKWIHPTGWINQNWLTHVIFYWLTHESPFADAQTYSFNTLVYWKFAIYIITVICVYYMGIKLGVNPALSAVFACFAMFVGRSFFDVRPAGFSNLLVAVFLLILILATYRNILYIWLIVPLTVFWCNVHGGYIYAFIMLVPFVALNFLTLFSKKLFVSIGKKGLYHTIAAGFVTLIAVILFNPFHLTSLTHTFVISFSEHAKMWRTVNEWHPAFEWSNPVGDEIPFLIMYIIAWVLLVAWFIVLILTSRFINRLPKRKDSSDEYCRPKIDLALMVIAALTIYMAIRSRRFIPIGAIAACPLLALFIDQTARAVSAMRIFQNKGKLAVPPMHKWLQSYFIIAGALAVAFFGTWWGLQFKYVYLDPWPTDTILNSVFMRMTASDAKPFWACQFIRMNNLKGKMFNYWTEGGFVAWGQNPDPETGKTPLQLFMDGRAQAAYEPEAYRVWSQIMFGGPIVQITRQRKQKFTSAKYAEIGKWIDKQLKKRDVWVVLMPAKEFNGYFVRGIERHPDWRLVFSNNKMKLFVDSSTPQAKELLERVVYPDDFTRYIIESRNLLLTGPDTDARKKGFELAIESFRINPSGAAMRNIVVSANLSELEPSVSKFCKDYFDDFIENKDSYVNEHGYHHRMVAAFMAMDHLQRMAAREKNYQDVKLYTTKRREFLREQKQMIKNKRW